MAMMQDAVLFLGAAVLAVPLMRKAGLGTVLGYLAAGLVIGPSTLGLVGEVENVLHFAELGVVFLLFIIGLELQPALLWSLRRPIFVLGAGQVGISALLIGLVTYLAGYSTQTSALVGLTLALSSTAFAVQIMADRKELATRYGRSAFSILLFQDLAVIPLLAIIPSLAPEMFDSDGTQITTPTDWLALLLSISVVIALAVGGRYVLRPLLRAAARSGATEVFTAAALLVVLGMGALLEAIGLSMALGAFIAGVLLADTEYRHRLEADIEPFKGLLLGLFFMAVGMSVNLELLLSMPFKVVGAAIGLMLLKSTVLFVLGRLSKLRTKAALSLAGVLPQGGEFAFVLFGAAITVGAIAADLKDFLILVVAVTMALTPLFVGVAARLGERGTAPKTVEVPDIQVDDAPRVIIAGFGRMGQIVARTLAMNHIKFVALDSDNARVEVARRFGNEAYFGEAHRLLVLEAAHASSAEILVITVDDRERATEIAKVARMHFPQLRVFTRAYDRFHAYELMEVGVDQAVRETFHSGLALARAVYGGLGVSNRKADRIIAHFRDYDEDLLVEQYKIHRDEAAMIQSTKDATEHLMGLFAQDAEESDLIDSQEDRKDGSIIPGASNRDSREKPIE
jgi:glutathione-regulated potassium-efflux system ancillary protein KefC/glutathione-regulated potassium-efflux system protein KefB